MYDYSGCREGYIRLAGGSNRLQGRVEVCHDEVWGTVCNTRWGTAEASVACRQLGHSDSGQYTIRSYVEKTSVHSMGWDF